MENMAQIAFTASYKITAKSSVSINTPSDVYTAEELEEIGEKMDGKFAEQYPKIFGFVENVIGGFFSNSVTSATDYDWDD